MRNLSRITNYANRIEAQRDWEKICKLAYQRDRADLVEKYQPKQGASWRQIDSAIAKLRSELEKTA